MIPARRLHVLFAALMWALAPSLFASAPVSTNRTTAAAIVRESVDGIDLLACRTDARGVITIEGALPAGEVFHPADNLAVPALVAALLSKGTLAEDKLTIAKRLEAVGATIDYKLGPVVLRFSAKCLKKDLPTVMAVLAEELRQPAFSEGEFDKTQQELTGRTLRRMEDTAYRAENLLGRTLFPKGHPNHPPSAAEMIGALETAKRDEVKAFYAARFGPSGMQLVATGDVDPAELRAEVAKDFGGWTGGGKVAPFVPARQMAGTRKVIFVADRSSVNVAWGETTGLRYGDPDALALSVGTAILGRGFMGRLSATVRDREGLSYGMSAATTLDTFSDGEWVVRANFAPNLLSKGIESTQRELIAWRDNGVTSEELERRKSNLIASYKVELSTTDGLARQILLTVERGYPLSWLDEYPSMVQALTVDQVNRAIRRHFDPSRLVLAEAGAVAPVMPPLD